MKTDIPEFLLEMAEQIKTQDGRCTAHPFYQVRCKRYVITAEGYNEHHWELVSEDSEGHPIYRSDKGADINGDNVSEMMELYPDWCDEWIKDGIDNGYIDEGSQFVDCFDFESHKDSFEDWPEGCDVVHLQEIEEVVSTHLTLSDAEWFINRKQHDYPKLYTYAESAYFSPQIRQLQDWLKSLTNINGE